MRAVHGNRRAFDRWARRTLRETLERKSRIHSVQDLRHPDDRACYFCLESPAARYNYLHHGPNPNLLPRYPQRLKSRAAVVRRLERELAKPGAVGL